jgi:solute:Na+ symporter, SSS family
MGALSSSALIDLYRPLLGSEMTHRQSMCLSRIFIAVFGLVLAAIAYALKDAEGLLWLTFQIASLTYGSLLGIVLLGILTHRGADRGSWIATLSGGLPCATLLAGIRLDWIQLGLS